MDSLIQFVLLVLSIIPPEFIVQYLAGKAIDKAVDVHAQRNDVASIQSELFSCLNSALQELCIQQGWEYDEEAINETFSSCCDIRELAASGSEEAKEKLAGILINALGHEVDEDALECWKNIFIDNICHSPSLNNYFVQSKMEVTYENTVRILEEIKKGLEDGVSGYLVAGSWTISTELNRQTQQGKSGGYDVAHMKGSGIRTEDKKRWSWRKSDLAQMKELLFLHNFNVMFLYGQPGIGKTVLARLFFEYLWVNSSLEGAECPCWQAYWLVYEDSLAETLKGLAKNQTEATAEKVCHELMCMQEPDRSHTILFIDNYDRKSLSDCEKEDSSLLRKLDRCGIKVVLTSRTKPAAKGFARHEVGEVEDAEALFYDTYEGDSIPSEESVKGLVELLLGNTMLVVLSAHLLSEQKDTTIDGLMEHVRNFSLKEVDTEVDIETDRIKSVFEPMPVYEQAKALLDFSGILSNMEMKKVMVNMALLPLAGMQCNEFLKKAHVDGNAVNRLVRSSWIIKTGNTISLHPVMREILLEKDFEGKSVVCYSSCEEYCREIKGLLDLSLPLMDRFGIYEYGDEVFRVFGKDGSQQEDLIILWYTLSDVHDRLAEWEMSRKLVLNVMSGIDAIQDPLQKARFYSGCQYSLVNNKDKKQYASNMKSAEEAYKRAVEILSSYPDKENQEWKKVKARVESNWGAYYLILAGNSEDREEKNRLYCDARKKHEIALGIRKDLLSMADDDDEFRPLVVDVATSYTTVATDCYYMGKYEDSVRNHKEAIEYRRKISDSAGIGTNGQRLVGSVLKWHEQTAGFSKELLSEALGCYPELISIYLMKDKPGIKKLLDTNKENFRKLSELVRERTNNPELLQTVTQKELEIQEMLKTE